MSDTTKMSKFERKVVAYSKFVIRWRWVVIPLVITFVALAGSGARFIQFDNDYRTFFGKENPQLIAFEDLQDIYTKNDNVLIVFEPKDGDVLPIKLLPRWRNSPNWTDCKKRSLKHSYRKRILGNAYKAVIETSKLCKFCNITTGTTLGGQII